MVGDEITVTPNRGNSTVIMAERNIKIQPPLDIKAKIMNEVGLDSLKSDVGITKFIEVMNNSFKKQDEVKLFEVYTDFF